MGAPGYPERGKIARQGLLDGRDAYPRLDELIDTAGILREVPVHWTSMVKN